MQRVLFLCTGNSCRSQMAEALVNHDLRQSWTASSAGTRPAGFVHPMALRALAEVGIPHQGASKPVDVFRGQAFDLVVTLCGEAEEDCPAWLGPGRRAHLGFPDPARATGTEEEILAAFRQVRDDIRAGVEALLEGVVS